MSVSHEVLNKVNRGSRRPVTIEKTLNRYEVSENGVSLIVTGRNEAVAIAKAKYFHPFSDGASVTFAGTYSYNYTR